MPRINADSLREQMVVATDVRNIDNMLLIPAGSALTARQIDILKAWGVTEIDIAQESTAADSSDPLAQLTPEQVAEITAALRQRFWKLDESNPAAVRVFELMLRRKARQYRPA